MPFKKKPDQLIIDLVYYCILWINDFLLVIQVSNNFFLREIVTVTMIGFSKHYKATFGTYVYTHEDNNPTNNFFEWMLMDAYLRPTENVQGVHKILYLYKRHRFIYNKSIEVPMS